VTTLRPEGIGKMFEDARELAALHALHHTTMLAPFEVCVPHQGQYQYHGKALNPEYATACTCKRAGFSPYETACFKNSPSVGDPMLSATNSPLVATSAPPRVDE
jgi:hypothetical protein